MQHATHPPIEPPGLKILGYGLVAIGVMAGLTGCALDATIELDRLAETFIQAPNDQVDILWVIDDTTTMAGAQAQLVEQFDSFAEVLDDAEILYRMGVVTTSSGPWDDELWAPELASDAYFTPAQGSAAAFAEQLLVGTEGSDKERGLAAALLALTGEGSETGPAQPFVREGADLLVVFVSDEEDCSDGGALQGDSPTSCYTSPERLVPVEQIVEALHAVHGDANRVLAAGIVGTESSDCADVYHGARYQRVARATGGWVADICDEDWSEALAALGAHATGLRNSFRLQEAAEPGSISVFVDQVELIEDPEEGFTYDPATWMVQFAPDMVPQRGATIRIEYAGDASWFLSEAY